MDFHEWMMFSELIIGEEGMFVFEQFAAGNISFEEYIDQMYKVMPIENLYKFSMFMNAISKKGNNNE